MFYDTAISVLLCTVRTRYHAVSCRPAKLLWLPAPHVISYSAQSLMLSTFPFASYLLFFTLLSSFVSPFRMPPFIYTYSITLFPLNCISLYWCLCSPLLIVFSPPHSLLHSSLRSSIFSPLYQPSSNLSPLYHPFPPSSTPSPLCYPLLFLLSPFHPPLLSPLAPPAGSYRRLVTHTREGHEEHPAHTQ